MFCVPHPARVCTLAAMAGLRFRASDIVVRGGVDLDTLALVLPRVDPRTTRIWTAPWWFRLLWGRRIAAVAMFWGIYVRPDVAQRFAEGREPRRNALLIVHELTHIEQWRRLGPVRHSVQYLTDYARSLLSGHSPHDAYRAIRLELEARQTARLVLAMTRAS